MLHGVNGRKLCVPTVVLVISYMMSAFCMPASAQPDIGIWSVPVPISPNSLIYGDLWGSSVFQYGWSSMAVSDDGGASWDSEIPFNGKICASDGVLYRANGSDLPEPGTLVFSKSTDNGATWSDPVVIMSPAGSDGAYRIARYDSTLIVYGFVNSGTSDGYIRASTSADDGATWSTAVVVDNPVHCEDPLSSAIVYLGGSIYITYYDYNDLPEPYSHIVVMESSDLGASWSDRRVVGSGYSPMIAADASALYVTYWNWTGFSDSGLYFTRSSDGDTWSTPVKVGDYVDGTDSQVYHAVTAAGGTVFSAYTVYDNTGGTPEYWVHVNYSSDGGDSWEDLGNVTGGDGDERLPNVMFNGTVLHLTWFDAQGGSNYSTFYRSLTFYEPVPEFSGIIIPVVGMTLISAAILYSRKRS